MTLNDIPLPRYTAGTKQDRRRHRTLTNDNGEDVRVRLCMSEYLPQFMPKYSTPSPTSYANPNFAANGPGS